MNNSEFTILIAEDQPDIAQFLYKGLLEEGYQCLIAKDGLEAAQEVDKQHIDLILLDWMMPKKTGLEVCKQLRDAGNKTPIIFLTAKDTVEDTIDGLKSGANDYIKKPFSFNELIARIETHLRLHYKIDEVLLLGDIELNNSRHQVKRAGKLISLTDKEYNFLAHLLLNKGQVCIGIIPIKIGMKYTIYPSYRFYSQSKSDYFYGFNEALSTSEYYTSDFDLAGYNAHQFGLGFKYYDPLNNLRVGGFGLKSINLDFNQYTRTSQYFDAYFTAIGLTFTSLK